MTLELIKIEAYQALNMLIEWAISPKFNAQIIAITLAWIVTKILKRNITFLHILPVESNSKMAHAFLNGFYTAQNLIIRCHFRNVRCVV